MSVRATRREFLALSAGAGMTALLVAFRPWRALVEMPASQSLPEARLAGLFRDPDSARRVGREYLRNAPDEASTARLVSAIAVGLPGGVAGLRDISDADLRELLSKRMVEDFDLGRTAELQGWVLSLTEARLCALTTLV